MKKFFLLNCCSEDPGVPPGHLWRNFHQPKICNNTIEKSSFAVACCVIEKFAGLTLPLLKMCQIKQLDAFSIDELIKSVQLALHSNRKNCEDSFKQIFTKVKKLCQKYEIPIMIPRRPNRQDHGKNYPINDVEVLVNLLMLAN